MAAVVPLRGKGRELAKHVKPTVSQRILQAKEEPDLLSSVFTLEYLEDFIQGHVNGMDPAIMTKLKAGVYSPEGSLDLHGQNMEQAYSSLTGFIKEAYLRGRRQLLVITGKGKNSPGGVSVLRERVQTWLTRAPFNRVVLAFCTATLADGGTGALYVLLRKKRKQGKIFWDRTPTEEELLL